jgi:hypothetical protein
MIKMVNGVEVAQILPVGNWNNWNMHFEIATIQMSSCVKRWQ